MIQGGLSKIRPDKRDYSIVHTFGGTIDPSQGLPKDFSIYDGRTIPNQNESDERFMPALDPLPFGCTAETLTFDEGIKTGYTYNPEDFYRATPPGTMNEGRDIRVALQTAIDRGMKRTDGTIDKELAYFNCYGSGPIDDYDAARFGLWINQQEKRGVIIGSWWYPEFMNAPLGYLPLPSYSMNNATLHCYLATGWESTYKDEYLEIIPWIGMEWGDKGKGYVSREIYNALMAQPWTGAFTITNKPSTTPVPIGVQAEIDHLLYYVRSLFHL